MQEHDVAWQKAFTVNRFTEWKEYADQLDQSILKKFKIQIQQHFGIPVKFPCMVFAIVDFSSRYIEYKFVYVEDARELIKIDRIVNSRLAKVMEEYETNN